VCSRIVFDSWTDAAAVKLLRDPRAYSVDGVGLYAELGNGDRLSLADYDDICHIRKCAAEQGYDSRADYPPEF
jgi:hypothetical protein